MSKVKNKQYKDPIFLEVKENVRKQKVLSFEQGGDVVLSNQGRLCVPRVNEIL